MNSERVVKWYSRENDKYVLAFYRLVPFIPRYLKRYK